MADQDSTTEIKDNESQEDVENTGQVEDETQDDKESQENVEGTEDNEDEDSDSSDDDDSDEDEDDETEDDEDSKFEKRFTQFKGDTPEEYIPNLEDGYLKSSNEAKRLASANKDLQSRLDAVTAAVAKNPDLAKGLNEALGEETPEVLVDPALMKAREDMEATMASEYNEFVEAHPEFGSDPVLQEEVLAELQTFAKAARKNGKILGMKEGLNKAWISLGKNDDSKEKLATAAKNNAAKPRTSSKGKKPAGDKPQFSPEQIAYAKKMGLTAKQLEEAYKK